MKLMALMLLAVVGLKGSIGARLLENGLFISPENPWAFDPKLSSVVHNEKTRLPCGEIRTLAFQKGIVDEKTPKSEEVVLHVLRSHDMGSAQRLAKSKHSPGVFHTPTSKSTHRSGASNKRILKSTPSPGAGH